MELIARISDAIARMSATRQQYTAHRSAMCGFTQARAGFTLVELLVVIAIIGLLSSIVLASLNSARQKGRDARRISDIKQLQLALELYYDANGVYPTSLGSGNTGPLVTGAYISVIPTDPSSNLGYAYAALQTTGTTCTSYHIGAKLEVAGQQAATQDANSSGNTPCTSPSSGAWAGNTDIPAVSGDFNGNPSPDSVYDLKP